MRVTEYRAHKLLLLLSAPSLRHTLPHSTLPLLCFAFLCRHKETHHVALPPLDYPRRCLTLVRLLTALPLQRHTARGATEHCFSVAIRNVTLPLLLMTVLGCAIANRSVASRYQTTPYLAVAFLFISTLHPCQT